MEMISKILFVFPAFSIGGTTVSTRNLISLLDKDGYDCWVMPMEPQGELLHLYDDVPRVETPFVIHARAVSGWKKETSWPRRIAAILIRALCKRTSWFEPWVIGRTLDKIVKKHNFNVVVAGQEALSTRLVSYAGLQNKVAWVRCDYRRWIEENHMGRELHYNRFRSIVCVSEKTYSDFKDLFPELASRIVCIPNPQDETLMQKRADMVEQEPRFKTENTTLVSVGRLDAIKRFDQIAPIARQLKEQGLKFHWYLIGDGVERKRIEDSIVEYGVENEVVMLGAKANPYYYIKRADIMVSLSRSEACPRVVNEAKILHTPTVSTDFPTIFEFIENGKTGLISPLDEIPLSILRLCNDGALYARIKENISHFTFDNTELIAKVKEVL